MIAAAETRDSLDPERFRDVLGHFCSGITVLAALEGADPVGFTCQSFFSLSIDPPLVAVAASKTSTSFPRVRAAEVFSVNVLSQAQRAVSASFARSGTDKWAGVRWQPGRFGAPLIENALAWLECRVRDVHDAGDHLLTVAEVLDLDFDRDGAPLLYFRSNYHRLAAQHDRSA